MSEGLYAQSAAAYEDYLRVYPTGGASQQDHITLILGILYARYTSNAARAKELLQKILPKLHNPQEKELAESELKRLDSAL